LVKEKTVSVIINAYNEEDDISDCLDSLVEQAYDDFELVVIDDGSTDDTLGVVRRYSDKFNLKTHRTEHIGLKKARKVGVKQSSGDIIVNVDADEILEPDFLENILEPFKDEKVGSVGGVIKSFGKGWVTNGYGTLNEIFYSLRDEGEEAEWVQGGCSAYRRTALEDVGGLPAEKVSLDKDTSWRMKDSGWKVILKKDAIVHHKDPQTLKSVMKREHKIGKREYHLLKRHSSRSSWKEVSRFYPLCGIVLLGLSIFYLPLLILLAVGALLTYLTVFYMVVKNIENAKFGTSLKSWIVLTFINLGWSIGYLRSAFGS